MVFSSLIFLFLFLPAVLIIYFLLSNLFLKNTFLFISSLIFYAWGEVEYTSVMLGSIILNYFAALVLEKTRSKKISGLIITSAVVLNLLPLFYFKYFNFLLESLGQAPEKNIYLPLGISFFTFHALSYLIDVYRGKNKAQKNFINLGLYISNFSQLVAGPIIRYPDVADQLTERKTSIQDFSYGVQRFIIGLGKKVLIANNVALVADNIFSTSTSELSAQAAWIGILCYSLQIYFDFSGYSDMAIGLGRMFGFHFLENFNLPYISKSIQEFWRRWHISLSNWFRDYVYIPLGGNRLGEGRTYLNLLIIFLLCGLWHGASWSFIVWGLWHGLFLILERIVPENFSKKIPSFLSHVYTLFVVATGWVFFRADTLEYALSYLKTMIQFKTNDNFDFSFLDNETTLAIIAGILISTPLLSKINSLSDLNKKTQILYKFASFIFLMLTFVFCGMYLVNSTYNPFIYFRF